MGVYFQGRRIDVVVRHNLHLQLNENKSTKEQKKNRKNTRLEVFDDFCLWLKVFAHFYLQLAVSATPITSHIISH